MLPFENHCRHLNQNEADIYFGKRVNRGGSRTAAKSKIDRFVTIVNYYHKTLHLGCCSSPRSASDLTESKIFRTDFHLYK